MAEWYSKLARNLWQCLTNLPFTIRSLATLSSLVGVLSLVEHGEPLAVPITCLSTSPTIESLASCFMNYTVPEGFYDTGGFGGPEAYTTAQPTSSERQAWRSVVESALNLDNGGCPSSPTDVAGLNGTYTIGLFIESPSSGGRTYCVISEKNTYPGTTDVFARGWGFVITAVNSSIHHNRALHFSAPHPIYDSTTPVQAAALFKRVGAKSLVVTGRHRMASTVSSGCAVPSNPADKYYRTDPAHDDAEPFHDALLITRDWQNAQGGCQNTHCAYIQWHRKYNSCPMYDMFLSSGPGNGAASHDWYHGPNSTLHPVVRLKKSLDKHMSPLPGTTHSLPGTDSNCQLTATKNIFGRIVNGRQAPEYCTKDAALAEVTGEFIHIEQTTSVILPDRYEEWMNALVEAFPPL